MTNQKQAGYDENVALLSRPQVLRRQSFHLSFFPCVTKLLVYPALIMMLLLMYHSLTKTWNITGVMTKSVYNAQLLFPILAIHAEPPSFYSKRQNYFLHQKRLRSEHFSEVEDFIEGEVMKTDQQYPVLNVNPIVPPVLCSQELNLYCPPSMKCCPKYTRRSSDSSVSENRGVELFLQIDNNGIFRSFSTFVQSQYQRQQNEEPLTIVGYTCLGAPEGMEPVGSCCEDIVDDNDDVGKVKNSGSGCGIGYKCALADPQPLPPLQRAAFSNNHRHISISQDNVDDGLLEKPHCQRIDDSLPPLNNQGNPMNLAYERTPRYHTCSAMAWKDIAQPYGLRIPRSATKYGSKKNDSSDDEDKDYFGQLAYFSNRGPIDIVAGATESSPTIASGITTVTTAIIVVHGAARNAGDYFCNMIRAVEDHTLGKITNDDASLIAPFYRLQEDESGMTNDFNYSQHDILVVAPWFLAPQDGEPAPLDTALQHLPFLTWNDTFPVVHSYRYGAESIAVPDVTREIRDTEGDNEQGGITISSFKTMDILFETLCNIKSFPNLHRIVVVGHSAGGQLVHRWGLSSNSWCFDNSSSLSSNEMIRPSIRLVAINPQTFTYLDERRYISGKNDSETSMSESDVNQNPFYVVDGNETLKLRPLTSEEQDACPSFNEYDRGLEDNPLLPTPYFTANMNQLLDQEQAENDYDSKSSIVFCRYISRDVVYMVGERDSVSLDEKACMQDEYEGRNRMQRSERFYSSLQVKGKEEKYCRAKDMAYDNSASIERVHNHFVIKNVGHNAALAFVSAEGQREIFEYDTETDKI